MWKDLARIIRQALKAFRRAAERFVMIGGQLVRVATGTAEAEPTMIDEVADGVTDAEGLRKDALKLEPEHVAQGYALIRTRFPDSTPPSISSLPEPQQRWLTGLSNAECKILAASPFAKIKLHMLARTDAHRIPGVPDPRGHKVDLPDPDYERRHTQDFLEELLAGEPQAA